MPQMQIHLTDSDSPIIFERKEEKKEGTPRSCVAFVPENDITSRSCAIGLSMRALWFIVVALPLVFAAPQVVLAGSRAQPSSTPVEGTATNVPGTNPASRLYAETKCERCGYSDQDDGWLQKLVTDPTATFTGVLAIFTLALVGVSAWQGCQIKRAERLTVAALRASQRQARAAALTAKNLLRATRPFCVMESLTLEPFSGAVPDVVLPEGYFLMSTHGTITNIGTANAFARDLQVVSSVDGLGEPLAPSTEVNNLVFAFHELKFGQSYTPPLPIHPTPVTEEFNRHDAPLFVWGYVRYMDIHGIVRRSGFAFEWIHLTQGFHPCGGSSYWYDLEEENAGRG